MIARLSTPALRYLLAILVVADIVSLAAFRLAASGEDLVPILQMALVVGFGLLTIIDFRAAVAIAVLELACAGASGRWTVFPGGVSGRIVLDAFVMARGLVELGLSARAGTLRLGRYAIHALLLAIVMPGVWMTLGIVNGNRPADVFGDGNGQFFFAFALVVVALAQRVDVAWLRKWLLIACAANAVVTLALALVALSGTAPIYPTLQELLLTRLDMGGVLEVLPNGLPRLYLGSGLYLQIGLALVTWELLRQPRRTWPWLLAGLIVFDLAVSWTRGYWLGAAVALGFVLVFGTRELRRPFQVLGISVAALTLLSLGALAMGSSLPHDILDRAIGVFGLGTDSVGAGSTNVKIVQAQVLIGHIVERPLLGWGFGTIAPDYPYGQIYSYELGYLDLAYKTGIVGALIFLSFPLRLVFDSVRGRLGRIQLASGVSNLQAAVPGAIVLSILVVGATNPYLMATLGLAPIILSIAWLDPFGHSDAA